MHAGSAHRLLHAVRARSRGSAVGLALLLATATSLADDHGTAAEVRVESCVDVTREALAALLDVELATLGVRTTAWSLSVSCQGEHARCLLTRHDAAHAEHDDRRSSGEPRAFRVNLSAVEPSSHARVLALASSELAARWEAEIAATPIDTTKPVLVTSDEREVPELADESRSSATDEPPAVAVSFALRGDVLEAPAQVLWGGELGLELHLRGAFALLAAGQLVFGEREVPLGAVSSRGLSAELGVQHRIRTGRVSWVPSLGVRGGQLLLRGMENDAATVGTELRGLWGGPVLGLGLEIPSVAPSRPSLVLRTQVGVNLFDLEGHDHAATTIVTTRPIWIGVSAGGAYGFGNRDEAQE